VTSYFDAFNDLVTRVYGMDNALLLDCFIGGLHPKLKHKVKSRCPISLMQAVSLARLFEEKITHHTQRWRTTLLAPIASIHKTHFHPTTKNLNHTPPPQSPVINRTLLPTPSKSKFMRKLSLTEIQFHRENNLCSTCDEKFTLAHKCEAKHYLIIQSIEEVPSDTENSDDFTVTVVEPREHIQIIELVHLSYNALSGITNRRSIHFLGTVHNRDIRISMDGGSSDNFIHPALVTRLVVPLYKAPKLQVQVGSGELLQCEGKVRDMPVKIQQNILSINAFVLPIAS